MEQRGVDKFPDSSHLSSHIRAIVAQSSRHFATLNYILPGSRPTPPRLEFSAYEGHGDVEVLLRWFPTIVAVLPLLYYHPSRIT